jgi:hypothetical protein
VDGRSISDFQQLQPAAFNCIMVNVVRDDEFSSAQIGALSSFLAARIKSDRLTDKYEAKRLEQLQLAQRMLREQIATRKQDFDQALRRAVACVMSRRMLYAMLLLLLTGVVVFSSVFFMVTIGDDHHQSPTATTAPPTPVPTPVPLEVNATAHSSSPLTAAGAQNTTRV